MDEARSLSRVARALADQRRVRILLALLEGEATVTDLAVRLDLPQPRVSTHLAALHRAGLVTRRITGRQHTYLADRTRIRPLLDALRSFAPPAGAQPPRSGRAAREVRDDSAIRRARTCYDHLAGVAAVDLLDALIERRWLTAAGGERPVYALTERGGEMLAVRGVAIERAAGGRRRFAFGCLDWTERRPHLAGALGAEVLRALVRAGIVEREPASRVVRLQGGILPWVDHHCPA